MANDNVTKNRRQIAVLWKANGFNNLGEVTVNANIEVKVRVEKGVKETLDPEGNVIASQMMINVGEEVPVGSLFWLGELEDLPDDLDPQLLQAIEYEETPDIKAKKFDRWVKVMRYHGSLTITTEAPETTTLAVVSTSHTPAPPSKPWTVDTTVWTFTGFDTDGSTNFRNFILANNGQSGQFPGNTIFDINGSSAKKVLLADNTRHNATDTGGWVFDRSPHPNDLDDHTQMEPVNMPSPAMDGL